MRDALEQVETLLADKTYLLADDRATSLDCLALGYFSLALVPDLPFSWLHDAVTTKAPKLSRYIERVRRQCFGPAVSVSDAVNNNDNSAPGADPVSLPWKAPERVSVTAIGTTLLNTLADATPILKEVRTNNRLREAAEATDSSLSQQESEAISDYALAKKTDLYVSVASVTVGFVALVGYAFHVGLVAFSQRPEEYEETDAGGEDEFQAADFLTSLNL